MDSNLDIFIKISEQLGKLNGNMESVLSQLAQHNTRITNLEKNSSGGSGMKDQLLSLLAKALVIGSVGIACLAGGAGILSKIFGA